MLLAAAYVVTTSSILATVALLYDYFVEVPSSIQRLVLSVQMLVSVSAIGQIAFNEILLTPVKERLTPENIYDMRKVAAAVFGLMAALAAAAYGVYRITMGPGADMAIFFVVAFFAALLSIAMMSFVLKNKSDVTDTRKLSDRMLMLPLKSASFATIMW